MKRRFSEVLVIAALATLAMPPSAGAQTGRDLVVSVVSSPAGPISSGSSIAVSDTVRNAGTAEAPSSVTRFYLSLDAVKSSNDIRLSGSRTVGVLAGSAESSGGTVLTTPMTAPAATYALFACADDTKLVSEDVETNNCTVSNTSITVVLSDLVETAVSNPPTTLAPGAAFTVTDTVQNPSAVTAAASVTRYYLSIDGALDAADLLLSGTRTIPILAAGTSSAGSKSVTVPATAVLSSYRVLACADNLVKVPEANETNNCLASATSLLLGWPDFVEAAVSNPPATAAPGTAFNVTDTVQNGGTAVGAASTTRYYLSLDGVKDAGDVLLTGTRSVATLTPGATATATVKVTIPTTAAVGTYRVLACADDLVKVPEANETNNCLAAATSLLVGWPDFLETTVSDPPAFIAPGQVFLVADTVANQGVVSAKASTTRYYLSFDLTKDPSDVLLSGSRSVPILSPSATSSGSRSVVVPTTTPFGTYVVLACADDLGSVAEGDNTNNCRATSPVTVEFPNIEPDADAGTDMDVSVGAVVHLDGLNSSDADGDPLTYQWLLLSRPGASSAVVADTTSPQPSFTVDVAGQYVVQLVVNDGKALSRPDVIVVAVGATRFVAMGDTGFGDAGQYAGAALVSAKCQRSGCGFVVLLGDNIYESGVSSVTDDQFNTKFEAPYAGIDLPFYVVLGNHDYGGNGWGNEFEKGQFEVDYSNLSPKWRLPAAYYRLSLGPIEFFGLDTNMQMYGLDQQQRADVDTWLSASAAPWKIALGHHPYRSNGGAGNAGAYGGYVGVPVVSGDGVKAFMDDIVCGRADLMLSGHDHNLQWLQPDGTCAGTELIVSGAGAKPKSLRSPTSAYYNQTYFQTAQLGFVYLVVTPGQLTAEFIGADGSVLFTRTLTKTP